MKSVNTACSYILHMYTFIYLPYGEIVGVVSTVNDWLTDVVIPVCSSRKAPYVSVVAVTHINVRRYCFIGKLLIAVFSLLLLLHLSSMFCFQCHWQRGTNKYSNTTTAFVHSVLLVMQLTAW